MPERSELTAAIEELQRAIDFFDRVKVSTLDEKIAVGRDHWDWLEGAARRVAQMNK